MNYNTYMLNENEIKGIIESKVKQNPDILYYIDDYYMQKIINLIIEGVAEAIAKSNEEILKNIGKMQADEIKLESFKSGIRY
ncbi:hypothetical protein ACG2QI_09545 [Bacillus sp. GM2]|uniref:hypothetical protein n=1 Tax=Bacillus TaxID=1386 RepID=UPI0003A2B48D|nr:hypothetical protein [Bacillus paralicheniformis]MED1713473.1 hypothetical protein [Bacillus paralicheniformis]MSO00810.1 hypothetical protein [Bacillus paralicheniformis]MSO04818.1 hypothetical protein [Bacillus paralicheniformis]MSO08811.1 hypothetical protein [Bacillus paralicheniformis]MSO12805.1 hypothetical protein [Bacillus paralicheniformis]